MQDKFIADLLGNKSIYPVTVKEMVEVLKPLIDEFRKQTYHPDTQEALKLIASQIKKYKRTEPVLFARSRRYLRTKRKILLRVILAVK